MKTSIQATSEPPAIENPLANFAARLPLPLAVWMVLLAVMFALLAGWSPEKLVSTINAGYGRALGEFALLLLPSFVLSFALGSRNLGGASGFASSISPLVGGAMVCPDSAYATLSPVAGQRKLETALGTYAGFKLLFPAGPLIVATGFGIAVTPALLGWGVLLLAVTWAVGVFWARRFAATSVQSNSDNTKIDWLALAPFALIAVLLIVVLLAGSKTQQLGALVFFFTPKGALLACAGLALFQLPITARADVVQSALRRTSGLLFTIGAASALGAVLIAVIPFEKSWPTGLGPVGGVGVLFLCAAILKLLQGSSMATFAAVTAIGGPIVSASGLGSIAAVFAVCLGTMVAITPNDSFYWLVRSDALQSFGESKAARILSTGSSLQGLSGLVVLSVLVGSGLV